MSDTTKTEFEYVGEFHWNDGLFFFRFDNGDVRIRKASEPAFTVIIPKLEWLSIETALSWEALHNRAPGNPTRI